MTLEGMNVEPNDTSNKRKRCDTAQVNKRMKSIQQQQQEEESKKDSDEMTDVQVYEIVEMLGNVLAKVKQDISQQKGNTPNIKTK